MFETFFDQPMGQHGPMWSQMGPCEPICAQWSPYGIIWADVGSYSLHVGPGGTYAAIWAHMGCQKPCGRTCSKPRLSQVPGPPYPYIYIDKHHTHTINIYFTQPYIKTYPALGTTPLQVQPWNSKGAVSSIHRPLWKSSRVEAYRYMYVLYDI